MPKASGSRSSRTFGYMNKYFFLILTFLVMSPQLIRCETPATFEQIQSLTNKYRTDIKRILNDLGRKELCDDFAKAESAWILYRDARAMQAARLASQDKKSVSKDVYLQFRSDFESEHIPELETQLQSVRALK